MKARWILAPAVLAAACAAASPPAYADPLVAAAGDVACDPTSSSFNGGDGTPATPGGTPPASAGKCHMKATGDVIDALAPQYVLGIGDLQNQNGAFTKFQQSYDPAWGRFTSKAYPVPGNHEYQDDLATGFYQYFHDRLAGFSPDAADATKGWYSFDVPVPGGTHWHIVALNSECAAGEAANRGLTQACVAGSAQEQWLHADLARDKSDCTLAFWHHPYLSSGGNGSTQTSGDSPQMRAIWEDLYGDYADIVLNGHRQEYERMAPQDPEGVPRPGRGIREWVVGTGGEILHTFPQPAVPPKAASQVRDDSSFGVLALTLHGPSSTHPNGSYGYRFVGDGQSASSFADSGSGDCVGPPRAAAVKPGSATTKAPATTTRAPGAKADRAAPRLTRARLSRRRFRVGRGRTARVAKVRRGTVIRYVLSEAATTSLGIERRRGRRYRKAGTLMRKGSAGRRRVGFSGRIGGRALRPGRYRLTLRPRDTAGNRGKARRLYFRVVR